MVDIHSLICPLRRTSSLTERTTSLSITCFSSVSLKNWFQGPSWDKGLFSEGCKEGSPLLSSRCKLFKWLNLERLFSMSRGQFSTFGDKISSHLLHKIDRKPSRERLNFDSKTSDFKVGPRSQSLRNLILKRRS